VLEATGGLERLVVAALALATLPVAVVNPRPAPGARRGPRPAATWPRPMPWTPRCWRPSPRPFIPRHGPCPTHRAWRSRPWSSGERQVVSMLTAEKNRLRQAGPGVRAKVAAHIAWLEQALQDLDGELDQTLRASPLWRERDQLLRRVPGVGPTVSLTLLARLARPPARAGPRPGQACGYLGGPRAAQSG
jgi:transposase